MMTHLENKPNPVTVAATSQPEPLEVILPITASRTRSPTVPLPSSSLESEEEN